MSIPPPVVVDAADLAAYTREIWTAIGGPAEHADLLAEHLVGANLTGHDSHGVGMLPTYVGAVRSGGLEVGGDVEIAKDAGAVLSLDAGHRLGQVTAARAMDLAIERAREHGVALVSLRRSHHVGRIGHWATRCADAGLASVHFVNVAGLPLVSPWRGIDARFGTNPFCAAFPRPGADPILLDLATSKIALGKTRVAHNAGKPVPPGSLLDADGHPTTDPGVMWGQEPHGTLRPFAEHKGYGLAMMCEILAGALGGGATTNADDLVDNGAIYNDMLSIVIDPGALDAPGAQDRANEFLEWVGASRLDPDPAVMTDPEGVLPERILAPGEPESLRRAHRLAHGVPVDPTTWEQIHDAAREAGVAPETIERFRGLAR